MSRWVVFLLIYGIMFSLFNVATTTTIAETGTIVDHDIVGNVTWTKEGSPYIIARSVAVKGTLTVEPGVTILWDYEVSLYVYGKVVIRGLPEEPVVLNVTDEARGVWGPSFIIGGGEVSIENAVSEFIFLEINNGKFVAKNIVGGGIGFAATTNEDAEIVIENAELWQIIMPGSYGRSIVEVNGEPEFVGNPVVLRNSSLILRNVFVKGVIGRVPNPLSNFSPTEFAPYIDTCYVEFSNVTVMEGIGFAANYTTVVMDRVTAPEFIFQWAYDSNVTITNSVFMYGRGIYTEDYKAVLKDKVTFTVHNTTFYKTRLDDSKSAITVYGDETAYFDLRSNYWGDTSYYIYGSNNVEVEPKLTEPTVELPPEITIELDPPYPMLGGYVKLIVKPELENAFYTLYTIYSGRSRPIFTDWSTNGTLKLKVVEETTNAILLVYYNRAIIRRDITVKAINPTQVELTAWMVPHPDEWNLIYTNTVTINASVYVPIPEILPYINVTLELQAKTWREPRTYVMRNLGNGDYTITLTLDDNGYSVEVIATYSGIVLARESMWFGIETKPPKINATCERISKDTVRIEVIATDMVTGVKRVTIYYNGEKLYEENGGGINKLTIAYEAKIEGTGYITVEAEDMAGHVGNVTLEIPSEITPPPTETTTTTTTSMTTTTTTATTTTPYTTTTPAATTTTSTPYTTTTPSTTTLTTTTSPPRTPTTTPPETGTTATTSPAPTEITTPQEETTTTPVKETNAPTTPIATPSTSTPPETTTEKPTTTPQQTTNQQTTLPLDPITILYIIIMIAGIILVITLVRKS